MLKGRYRDVVTGPDGRVLEMPWRSNLIVDGAFALLASRLRSDPSNEGPLYWAVGTGVPGWDRSQPATVSRTARLSSELLRLEVPDDAISYIDDRGRKSSVPTSDLELELTFEWPEQRVTLREFGIFAGEAAEDRNGGVMVNHVIHRRVDLGEGQRLTRKLHLAFGRGGDRRWTDVAPHWLGDSPVRVVDGVGAQSVSFLESAGVPNVEALALSDPYGSARGLSTVRLTEMRAKARLALRTAAEIHPPTGLNRFTVTEILTIPADAVATEAEVAESEVVRLREQLATLELALDHRFVRRLRVGALAAGEASDEREPTDEPEPTDERDRDEPEPRDEREPPDEREPRDRVIVVEDVVRGGGGPR